MMRPVSGPASYFLNEVGDWLLAKNDKRLKIKRNGERAEIDDLVKCCSDFCGFLAELTERGIPAKEWRDHVNDATRTV